jgi:hypothetical protein
MGESDFRRFISPQGYIGFGLKSTKIGRHGHPHAPAHKDRNGGAAVLHRRNYGQSHSFGSDARVLEFQNSLESDQVSLRTPNGRMAQMRAALGIENWETKIKVPGERDRPGRFQSASRRLAEESKPLTFW